VHNTEDLAEISSTDWKAREARGTQLVPDGLCRLLYVKGYDVSTRTHDLDDPLISKAEDTIYELLLGGDEHPASSSLGHKIPDLVLGDGRLLRVRQTQ
jgi:hypothetical protein